MVNLTPPAPQNSLVSENSRPGQPRFVHLDVHSEYSLVDSTVRIADLVARAAALGMPAVALTDHCNIFALVKFFKAARRAGVKPLAGAELLLDPPHTGAAPYRLNVLCRTRDGYRNLCRLLSTAYLNGRRHPPSLERSEIARHSGGLIALAGRESDIGEALGRGEESDAEALLDRWMADFPGAFYLAVARLGLGGEERYNAAALRLAGRRRCPVAAVNAVRFLDASGFAHHDARVCIHQGRQLNDPRRPADYRPAQYFKSPAEMAALFADCPSALANTLEIARRCNLDLEMGHYRMPEFPAAAEGGESAAALLSRLAHHGLREKLAKHGMAPEIAHADYQARLERELAVIGEMGFAGYFLIVADFVRWAKDPANDVPVGPGRGSGAGSLVAWALGITGIDPLRHDLLFERFLNPERVSMPDFDIDFCMEKRGRVIDYVARTYGRERVSQIITFGTMAARAVVRDAGRVLGQPYSFVDGIAKLIPQTLGIQLAEACTAEPQLAARIAEDPAVAAIFETATALEGLVRNAGTHAGGVVIAPVDLTELTALYVEPGGETPVIQFDKDDAEAIGLIKFDFLGLRTLTILHHAVTAINAARRGRGDPPLDLEALPLDDRATYDLLRRAETTAVFQLESRGMRDLMRRLKPDTFADIVALVALFRPGPLEAGMVNDYIERKHGRAAVAYLHPSLKPILAPTYGVILYQEQVMEIARTLAGYTLGAADILRRAMGKKNAEAMAEQRAIFVAGAAANGVAEPLAQRIFDLMETFGGYGFNKSHSVAYALLAYQTAWLKVHHPAEFMAAVLSCEMDDSDKVAVLIGECRAMGIEILPPDVWFSDWAFKVDHGAIRFGLGAIKGLGQSAVDELCRARARRRTVWQTAAELAGELDPQRLNRRAFEALVKAGALDRLENDRGDLIARLPAILKAAEQQSAAASQGQTDLFGNPLSSITEMPVEPAAGAWSREQRLAAEHEALGFYFSGHPLDTWAGELPHLTDGDIRALHAASGKRGTRRLAGLLLARRRRPGKGAFLTLGDPSGRIDVMVSETLYLEAAEHLEDRALLHIEGELANDEYSGGVRLAARAIRPLAAARHAAAQAIHLTLAGTDRDFVKILARILAPHRNDSGIPLILHYRAGGAGSLADLVLGDEWKVASSEALLAALAELPGVAEVRLGY